MSNRLLSLNPGVPPERVEPRSRRVSHSPPIIRLYPSQITFHRASCNVVEITHEGGSQGQLQESCIFFLTTIIRMLYSIVGLY